TVSKSDRTLRTWNATRDKTKSDSRDTVFFYFHGIRIVSSIRMLWYRRYEVGSRARRYYEQYTDAMRSEIIEIAKRWGEYPILREPRTLRRSIARLWYGIRGRLHYEPYHLPESR